MTLFSPNNLSSSSAPEQYTSTGESKENQDPWRSVSLNKMSLDVANGCGEPDQDSYHCLKTNSQSLLQHAAVRMFSNEVMGADDDSVVLIDRYFSSNIKMMNLSNNLYYFPGC